MSAPSPYFIRRSVSRNDVLEGEFTFFSEELTRRRISRVLMLAFLRHRARVLIICLGVIGVVGIRDLLEAPKYTATTTILFNKNAPRVASGDASQTIITESSSFEDLSNDQTEIEFLRSPSIANRVILAERLNKPVVHQPLTLAMKLSRQIEEWWSTSDKAATNDADHLTESVGVLPNETAAYLSNLRVTPVERSRLVKVSLTSPGPGLSARLANAHVREFVQAKGEVTAQAGKEADRFLSGKLSDLELQIQQSEVALNDYERQNGIVPGLIAIDGKGDVVLERLKKIEQDLDTAHLEVISLGAEVALINEGRSEDLPETSNDSLVQNLKAELDRLQEENASLASEFKPEYPPMQALRRKIQNTKEVLSREVRNVVLGVNHRYQTALQKEKILLSDLNEQKALATSLNNAALRYLVLERDVHRNRELYDSVLARMKTMSFLNDSNLSDISIVDRAVPPRAPSSPKIARDLLAAGGVGLLLAFVVSMISECLDTSLRYPAEAESYLQAPNLAVIPDFAWSPAQISAKNAVGSHLLPQQNSSGVRELAKTDHGSSYLFESYRSLRTALLFCTGGRSPKTVLITSALPHEGKTTVATNTAILLAQTGQKVLLVDADLRKPRCHKLLSRKSDIGLSEMLKGSVGATAISRTAVPNLSFLSSGSIPPNPSELLGSRNLKDLLNALSIDFDHIVIDSSPVMVVTDAIALSTVVDAVVLVAAVAQTPRREVNAAISRMRQVHAPIFGFVLNKAKFHKFEYADYHYSRLHSEYYANYPEPDDQDEDFVHRMVT